MMWLHAMPDFIFAMYAADTLYLGASFLVDSGDLRIAMTWVLVSFTLPCFSPLAVASGFVCLPWHLPVAFSSGVRLDQCMSPLWLRALAAISAILSLCVPKNRCAGLTHNGLSHLWHTNNPSGISPHTNSHANLWARLCLAPKQPYPLSVTAPFHSQHLSVFSTRLQNLYMVTT